MTITRREFATITAATGYALAVCPVTALAITTPATDLDTADVKIKIGKDELPAYTAYPKKGGALPVVIVVHEIFGVHEYVKDVCRRFANEGYYAIAPDLFFRAGDATKISDIDKLRAEIVSKATQKQVMDDLDAVVAWIGTQKRAKAKALGITGFCWGGNTTWMYAAHNTNVKAGVAWYGRLVGDATPAQPKFPVDVASTLQVPVLGLYGERDKGIPLDTIEKMKTELAKGKSGSRFIVYKDAEHAFHADYRPSYQEKGAKEAWGECLTWFKTHVKA